MGTFHRVEDSRARLGTPTEIKGRLPLVPAAGVIAGLSALSWAILFSIVVALRAVL
jgi:hypothetical protein